MIQKPEIVSKGWGAEVVIHNSKDYCGKLLIFKIGSEGSTHFHINKKESWYLVSGEILVELTNKETADVEKFYMEKGDTITIERGQVHKVIAFEDSTIFEVSTFHEDSDTYRVGKGDSQK